MEKYCFQVPNQANSSNIQRQNLYGMPSNNKTGHWSEKENAKYFAFLKKFKEKFSEKESRRQWKVFKTLSEFVKTRNANQCRSHHHKMQRNFETIE
jgi:RecA-family ATPase